MYLLDCNVRTANNTSLIPTLLKDASMETSKPLLIRIIVNVSLGAGLNQALSPFPVAVVQVLLL